MFTRIGLGNGGTTRQGSHPSTQVVAIAMANDLAQASLDHGHHLS